MLFHSQPKLFEDPKIVYPIHDLSLPFSNYVSQCKQIIREHRIDSTEKIVEANAPFEFYPENFNKQCGVLLIHGLFDSPFMVREIGEYLKTQNMLVRSVLLPGHGTVPGALLNVTYEDWLATINYGIKTLQQEVETIYLVGFSTGGALALQYAANNPNIAAVASLAPAIKIYSNIDFTANWHEVISWAWPRSKWFQITPEIDYTKYQSVAFNSVYQVYRITQELKKLEKKSWEKVPLFFILSNEDEVVFAESSLKFFERNSNAQSKMHLYTNKELFFEDKRIQVKSSIYPEDGIINFSHICLPVSRENFHYGENGDCPYASHINNKNIFGAVNRLDEWFLKLFTKMHVTNNPPHVLTFNPDFDSMKLAIAEFLVKN